jgi:PrtD family type I secretion system ABC transporter
MATCETQSAVYPLLKRTLAACRGGFLAVGLFSLAINLLLLTIPLYMLQLFDRVLTSRSEDTLFALSIAAGGAILTLAALEAVRSFVMVRLTGPAIFPFLDAPWTPVFIAVIFLFHPLLGWLSIIGAAVLFAMALINELSTRNLLMQSGGASIKSLRVAESAVRNADVIEAMGMMPNIVQRWRQENSAMLELQAKASQRSGAITAASRFLRLFLQVAMLGVGAWLAINDEVSPGAMIAGSILLGRALAPVEQAIGSWKSAVSARGAYNRIKRQLDSLTPRAEAMALPAPAGQLSVEGMSYLYPGATEPVLRNLDFRLEPGESVGLIGPTAVGKTTLARLAVGNLRPSAGHIRLDTADVAQWDPVDLGQYIGYLPQDVELFAGTVRENIARMGEGDPEQVVAAATPAGVHEIILGLPAGYETEIGEDGAVLSGGQRQRIGLARAVFGNPKFIVLDEPNANLDHEGEVALLETVARLKAQGATMVIIAHRPSVLRNVDKILVLRNGGIQLFGARDEVLAKLAGPAAAPATISEG